MSNSKIEPFNPNNKALQKEGIIVTLPLRKNVPEPRNDWKPAVCPVCNAACWYNPVGDEQLKLFKGNITYMCTECALKHR